MSAAAQGLVAEAAGVAGTEDADGSLAGAPLPDPGKNRGMCLTAKTAANAQSNKNNDVSVFSAYFSPSWRSGWLAQAGPLLFWRTCAESQGDRWNLHSAAAVAARRALLSVGC